MYLCWFSQRLQGTTEVRYTICSTNLQKNYSPWNLKQHPPTPAPPQSDEGFQRSLRFVSFPTRRRGGAGVALGGSPSRSGRASHCRIPASHSPSFVPHPSTSPALGMDGFGRRLRLGSLPHLAWDRCPRSQDGVPLWKAPPSLQNTKYFIQVLPQVRDRYQLQYASQARKPFMTDSGNVFAKEGTKF